MAACLRAGLVAILGIVRGIRLDQAPPGLSPNRVAIPQRAADAESVANAVGEGALIQVGVASDFPVGRMLVPALSLAGTRSGERLARSLSPSGKDGMARADGQASAWPMRPPRSPAARGVGLAVAQSVEGEEMEFVDAKGHTHVLERVDLPREWVQRFEPNSLRPVLGQSMSSGRFHVALAAKPEMTVRLEILTCDNEQEHELRIVQLVAGLPHVANYLDHCFVEGKLYLVLECMGRRRMDDIFAELAEDKPLLEDGEPWKPLEVSLPASEAAPEGVEPWFPLEAGLPLVLDVLRGVEGLDSRKVVHLDLSEPSSVSVRDRRAIIAGFEGMSCMIDGNPECRAWLEERIVGSAYRQAPEMRDGMPTGPENHVWQVGLLLAKMTLAICPTDRLVLEHIPDAYSKMIDFSREGRERIHEVIRTHFSIREEPRFQALEQKAPDIARLLEGMLENDPSKRWTARQASQELKAVMQSREMEVLPPLEPQRLPDEWFS
mmetsp:Transcript_124774/g.358345  ORF Transcript_124774/g.358345 Transcript_124774/m.358345 type:complete len:492 (+) Transcript_124774:91-1566(+)